MNSLNRLIKAQGNNNEQLKRIGGVIVSVLEDYSKATVKLHNNIGTEIELINCTGNKLVEGDFVWVHYWGNITSGYIAIKNGKQKSLGSNSLYIENAAVMTEEQGNIYTVSNEIVDIDVKNNIQVEYGDIANPIIVQGIPVIYSIDMENMNTFPFINFVSKQLTVNFFISTPSSTMTVAKDLREYNANFNLYTIECNGKNDSNGDSIYSKAIIEGYYYGNKFYKTEEHTTTINTPSESSVCCDIPTGNLYFYRNPNYFKISDTTTDKFKNQTSNTGDELTKNERNVFKYTYAKLCSYSYNGITNKNEQANYNLYNYQAVPKTYGYCLTCNKIQPQSLDICPYGYVFVDIYMVFFDENKNVIYYQKTNFYGSNSSSKASVYIPFQTAAERDYAIGVTSRSDINPSNV